jgi:hypothetical protein
VVSRGHYASTGERLRAFESRIGGVDIVEGYTNFSFGGEQGPQEDLIYMLILGPIIPVEGAHSESGSSDFGTYLTTLDYSWAFGGRRFAVSIRWNRETDTVSVGSQEFSRDKDNVLMVRIDESGKVLSQQLSSPGPHSSHQQALQYIQQQLTNDAVISSLKLYKNN